MKMIQLPVIVSTISCGVGTGHTVTVAGVSAGTYPTYRQAKAAERKALASLTKRGA